VEVVVVAAVHLPGTIPVTVQGGVNGTNGTANFTVQ
jgi:hypothetical protein